MRSFTLAATWGLAQCARGPSARAKDRWSGFLYRAAMWPHGGDSGANGISRMFIENPCCEFLRRIMIAGEEPCVLSAPKGKPRRGCATARSPAPEPTGDRNYWDRRRNAPAPPVFRDARYATPGSVGWGRTRTHHAVFGVA